MLANGRSPRRTGRFGRIPIAKESCYQGRVTTTLESLVAQMTVAELAQRSGRSISDVIELVLSHSGSVRARPSTNGERKRGAKPAPAAPAPRGKKGGAAQVRTQAGRANYDESVLAAVKASKGKAKAEELRKKIGGTPPQLRAALARLIEDGKVKSTGKARGTAYTAL
jgi:hypothetical protein